MAQDVGAFFEPMDFSDLHELLGAAQSGDAPKDDPVAAALEQGVRETKRVASNIDSQLLLLEEESVGDYVASFDSFQDLHQEILATDAVLEKMERLLGTFQSDLSTISDEIRMLQTSASAAPDGKLAGPAKQAKQPAVRVKAWRAPEQEKAVDVRRPVVVSLDDQVRILHGVPLSPILVGGHPDFEGYGQNPPSEGDSWELDVTTERGGYEICFTGGCNPHHGILSVYMDGTLIGNVDQYSRLFNICPHDHILYWDCMSGGRHTLTGTVHCKRPESRNYWICLREITLRPVPSRCTLALLLQAVWLGDELEVQCTGMAGNSIAVFLCDTDATVGQLRRKAIDTLSFAWHIALTLPHSQLLREEDDQSLLISVFGLSKD
ncbi:VPS52 [Symbiodinium natans]|uniref:VPS52 protein n=1 Tax=Symbiodinium natans TaxID=878477 RepID=A0A812NLC3_9DINO|nr:VPS52 [Symbiodinium natans]